MCDRVRESKTEAQVYNLGGVRQRIVVQGLPVAPVRLWLFLVLSSHQSGAYPGYIRVLDDETDKAIFFAHLAPDPRFDDADESLAAAARLKCSFPHTGRYTVQIWFYQEQGSDVLKGERPFLVAKESDS